jgi:hypothetical protein
VNHRRPNPDELTPDDLFRPADGGPTAGYGAPLSEPEVQSAATQYLPPMPSVPSAEPQSYGAQPGYAAPTQAYQGFPQQPQTAAYGRPYEQSQQPPYEQPQYEQAPYEPAQYDQGGYDQGYEQGGYDQGGYGQYDDQGYDDDPHRNRPSMRTLAIAVVAGCAVVGIGLGALLSGGGSSASATAGKGTTANHGTTAGGPGPGDKSAQHAQAQALSQLLETASSNRLAVVNAVDGVQSCQALPQAQATLTSAAQARADLVTKLGQLQVSALPSGSELVAKLTAGWQASQQADSHYAAWAVESEELCQKKHHPKDGGESTAAISASSEASNAKREAAELWNRIASANNLPTKSMSQL